MHDTTMVKLTARCLEVDGCPCCCRLHKPSCVTYAGCVGCFNRFGQATHLGRRLCKVCQNIKAKLSIDIDKRNCLTI